MRYRTHKPLADLIGGDTVHAIFDGDGESGETQEFTWQPGETRAQFRARVKASVAAYEASLTAPPAPAEPSYDVTEEL